MFTTTERRLRDKLWKKISNSIIERDSFSCQKCGAKKCNLHVHHIVPFRISHNNNAENLITLCMKCHAKEENNYRRYGITHYTTKPILTNITKEITGDKK